MLRKTKASMLTLATVLAAGCAHTDLGSKARKNASWALLDQPKHENVKDIPEPKILPQTYFAAAKLLEQEGEIRAAITQYRKAIAVNHNFVGAYHRLGLLLSSMGLHDEAIQSLSRATMMAPANVVVRNNYGFTLMIAQRWEEAAAQFRRCTELQPQFTRAYVNLGMTLTRLDRFDDALATFRKVLPEPDAYYNLGLMYRVLGRYDDAADSFRSALAANPAFVVASAELREITDRLAPEKVHTPTVVTAIPLGRGADKKPTHASPIPANPQANPTNETREFVVVEGPILIADSMDATDAAMNPNSATSAVPSVGSTAEDPLYQTRTRDALIALQADSREVDRTADLESTQMTPRIDPLTEPRQPQGKDDAVDNEVAPNAATQPPIGPPSPTPQLRQPTKVDTAAQEPQPKKETTVTETETGPTIAELTNVKPDTKAEPAAPPPVANVTSVPNVTQAETDSKTPIEDDRRGLDDSPFPRPNMDPAYVIIGPTEIDPYLEKMRLAKEREANQREARAQERLARLIDEPVHVAKVEIRAVDQPRGIVVAEKMAEESTLPEIVVDQSAAIETTVDIEFYSLADDPVSADIPATADQPEETSLICELDTVGEVLTAGTAAIDQAHRGHLDPSDSEAIVAAFERHLRSFSSDDPCWDEIDWQSWELIDPTQFAVAETITTERIAAIPATRKAKEAEEDAAFLRGEVTPDIAVLIREAWMDAPSADDAASPAADPFARSDSSKLQVVHQNRTLPDDVAPIQMTTAPVNRRAVFYNLARELDRVHAEIRCWDDILSNEIRTSTTPVTKTTMTQTKERTKPAIISLRDIEADMTEKMPPFERANLDLFADRLPLVLDRACVDLTLIVPSSLPPVVKVMANGSFAASQVVAIRPTAVGLPILVREERVEPYTPYAYRPWPASQAYSQPTLEFDWQETFGLLDDLISIVLNDSVCLESNATNSPTLAVTDNTESAAPQRTTRPTLASTIVKPAGR